MSNATELLTGLTYNASLLLSLVILYQLVFTRLPRQKLSVQILTGLFFGVIVMIGIALSVQLKPGVIFDARSVILSLAGLFGGPVAGILAALMASTHRAMQGGTGVYVGILVALTATAIGIAGYYLRQAGRWQPNVWSIFSFSFIVHAVSLCWMLLLPQDIRWQVFQQVSIPFLVVLPLTGFLAGILMLIVEDRHRSEMRLKRSDELLNEMGDRAKIGGWGYDVRSGKVSWTRQVAEIHDLPLVETITRDSVLSFYHGEHRAKIEQALESAIEQGKSFDLTLEIISRSGRCKRVHTIGTPVWEHGEVIELRGSIQDITETWQAQAELAYSEKRLRLLIEHAPVPLAMFDNQMCYIAASDRWMSNFNLGDTDIIGRCHYDIFPEVPERWKDAHRRGLQGEVLKSDEDKFETQDGSVHWSRWEVRPWYTAKEEVGGIILFVENITQAHADREALKKSESNFRHLFENAEVSIWNEDLSTVFEKLEQLRHEGVTNLRQYLNENQETVSDLAASVRVLHVNQATLKMFGATSQKDFIQKIQETFGPGALDVFCDELCAIWDKKKVFRSDAIFHTLDGRDLIAIISLPIPDVAEAFNSVPVSILDITERRRAETELHEHLDELNRWQQAMLGREERIIKVKQEVNALLAELGQPPRYHNPQDEGTEP